MEHVQNYNDMKEIIQLLNLYEYYGISERVDIAKGKYSLPYTFSELWNVIKRRMKGK